MKPAQIEKKAREIATPAQAEADEILSGLADLVIADRDDAELAAVIAHECKTTREALDEQRKTITTPLREAVDATNAHFKPPLDLLKQAEAAVKALIVDWRKTSIAEGDRQLTAAGLLGNADAVAAALALREAPEGIPGVQVRRAWAGSVVDASKIPREYLTPDLAMLEKVTKASGGAIKIAGWQPEEKTSIALVAPKASQ